MDDTVIRAMGRWPNVPAVFGYLSLDLRGHWLLRGKRLEHEKTLAFINRNYDRDPHGRWFFQNGPQRAFVALSYTPWIYRLSNGALTTHTGLDGGPVDGAWMDETGHLLLHTPVGIGLLHDHDLPTIADLLTNASGDSLSQDEALSALDGLVDQNATTTPYLRLGSSPIAIAPLNSGSVATRFHFTPEPMPIGEEAKNAHVAKN